ncbi:MAG: hypothetical protein R2695_03365 [Acidimicrobiales bacterium]
MIVQDADLEYDPDEYELVLQPLLDDLADVVYGSRFQSGRPRRCSTSGTPSATDCSRCSPTCSPTST